MRFPRNETLRLQQLRCNYTDSRATAGLSACASPHPPRHPGLVPGFTEPLGRLPVGLIDRSPLTHTIPSPARWTPQQVRVDGVCLAEVAA